MEAIMRDEFLDSPQWDFRFLQESNSTGNSTGTKDPVPPNDSQVLRDTLRVYGSFFLIVFVVFCCLRSRYRRTFNVRSWVPDLKCELAEDMFGYFSWLWKVHIITDDQIREQCGMDALCFLRMIHFGYKICLVGMFNSIWLFPVYATVEPTDETDYITDNIAKLTVSFIPSSSPRFLATVFAAYIIFGYAMHLMLQEFKWFTSNRDVYFSEREARNYTVYVSGIPEELRSNHMLLKYFQDCFPGDFCLEANVALNIPQLEKKVSQRKAKVANLEHLINIEEIKGTTPMRRNVLSPTDPPENAINAMIRELNALNEEIEDDITRIEDMHKTTSTMENAEEGNSIVSLGRVSYAGSYSYSVQSTLPGIDNAIALNGGSSSPMPASKKKTTCSAIVTSVTGSTEDADYSESKHSRSSNRSGVFGSLHKSVSGARDFASSGVSNVKGLASNGMAGATGVASSAINLLLGSEEGEPRNAGFVSFKNLSTTQAAMQMIHSTTPFCMHVVEASDPDDIFWNNVGKTNKEVQVGKLVSFTLTALLCVFWTIPMTFIASLTTVESLSKTVPFLGVWIEKAPWLGAVLAQLAPLLLIGVNALLPMILEFFSSLEGPVADSNLVASTFPKLAAFMIIQTFFVSAVSGSILTALSAIAEQPTKAVQLLAVSLPGQSTYFLQIILVQTFVGLAVELLRVSPLALAFCRSLLSPKLTEKERSTTLFGFLRPLNDPLEFQHAECAANNVLFFVVLFVYSTMAPLVNWFLAFCFALMNSGYRNQFFYNYPTRPDSGGMMWITFIRVIQASMIIAELTLIGFLALKQAAVPGALMFPLLIGTFIFNWYIGQQHFVVVKYLSSHKCIEVDRKNLAEGLTDFSFVKDEYKQEALKEKAEVFPDNLDVAREVEHGNAKYETPPASEADIEEVPVKE